MRVQCPMCHGYGEYYEPISDLPESPAYMCQYCNGEGYMEKDSFYFRCLGWLSGLARWKRKCRNDGSVW